MGQSVLDFIGCQLRGITRFLEGQRLAAFQTERGETRDRRIVLTLDAARRRVPGAQTWMAGGGERRKQELSEA